MSRVICAVFLFLALVPHGAKGQDQNGNPPVNSYRRDLRRLTHENPAAAKAALKDLEEKQFSYLEAIWGWLKARPWLLPLLSSLLGAWEGWKKTKKETPVDISGDWLDNISPEIDFIVTPSGMVLPVRGRARRRRSTPL
jgi:hypothetical protein